VGATIWYVPAAHTDHVVHERGALTGANCPGGQVPPNTVGADVGKADGEAVGVEVGDVVGAALGAAVGTAEGADVGAKVGPLVGLAEGAALGAEDGVAVGDAVGVAVVGDRVTLAQLTPESDPVTQNRKHEFQKATRVVLWQTVFTVALEHMGHTVKVDREEGWGGGGVIVRSRL
jgi:hypothetical protein